MHSPTNKHKQNAVGLFVQQNFQNLASCLGNRSTGAKDSGYTSLVQEVIVLCGDYTTGNHDNILTAQLLQFGNDLWNQSLVTGGQ